MSKAHAIEDSSSKDLKEEDEEKQKKSGDNHEEDQCTTPISQDQRIQAPQSCPPAPKKRKRSGVLRKRKLSKLEFFEKTGKEEVDSFFQFSSEISTSSSSHVAPETTKETTSKTKKRRKNS